MIKIEMPYKDDEESGIKREECPICLDNDMFTYKAWVKLECSHTFHIHCIDLWRENHSDCPLCRLKIEILPNSMYITENTNQSNVIINVHDNIHNVSNVSNGNNGNNGNNRPSYGSFVVIILGIIMIAVTAILYGK